MGLALAVVLVLGFSALGLAYYNEAPMLRAGSQGRTSQCRTAVAEKSSGDYSYENIGRYGGTHVLHCNPNVGGRCQRDREGNDPQTQSRWCHHQPNLATAWEISEDKDGDPVSAGRCEVVGRHPFTADDILFGGRM